MQKPAVTIMVKAARAAGNVLLSHMNRLESIKVEEKGRMDFASEVDRKAEEIIIKELKYANPDFGIIGEESGASKLAESGAKFTYVIDPLDGTSNYLHGIGHFCVSIALCEDGEPIHGVIFDPLRNDLFTASKGSGAMLNDKRIRVADRNNLEGAMIITGFPPRERERIAPQMRTVEELLGVAEDIRRTGSAALDLAYVAAGKADAYFEAGVKPWDIAAGVLMVRESGGKVCDFNGLKTKAMDMANVEGRPLVAGNVKVADALVKTIQSSGYAAAFR